MPKGGWRCVVVVMLMCSVVLQLWSQASALSLRLLPTALRRRQHVSSLSPTATATAAGTGSASRDPGWVAALQMLRDSRERYVIVDAKNGLGNRLRALASAMAVAATLDRPLLLVWVSDLHCNCSFRRLFAQPLPFTLLEEEIPPANLTDPRHFQRYNYMRPEPGAVKDAPIIPDPRRHLYFKSAFVMNHAHGKWTHAQQQIQRLVPAARVARQLIADKTMVGLHIRNVFDAPRDSRTFSSTTGNEAIAAAEKEYGRKGTSKLLAWRKAAHWSNFVPRITSLVRQHSLTRTSGGLSQQPLRFYLAADSEEAYASLLKCTASHTHPPRSRRLGAPPAARSPADPAGLSPAAFSLVAPLCEERCFTAWATRRRFPNRILVTRRECASERCDFRDCEGTLYALVDMLNLARTRLILGSGWSSYSEVAAYLGGSSGNPVPILMAGRDFGALVGAEHGRYSPKTPCCNPLEGGTDGEAFLGMEAGAEDGDPDNLIQHFWPRPF